MSVRDYRGLQPRNDNRDATRDILSLRLATLAARRPRDARDQRLNFYGTSRDRNALPQLTYLRSERCSRRRGMLIQAASPHYGTSTESKIFCTTVSAETSSASAS